MPMNEITRKTLEQVVEECGRYPLEAFEFVRMGLNHTVQKLHGDTRNKTEQECHVSGQQLSWGLRDFAVEKYGLMARVVLGHWGIVRTNDFGRIVFAMIDNKLMQKTDEDDLRDFHQVYDFGVAFDAPKRPVAVSRVVFEM